MTAGEKVIAAARTQLGVEEQPPGSNNGPQEYLVGDPWCGRFVMYAYKRADVDDQGIASPSTWSIYDNARHLGRVSNTPLPGCMVVWRPGAHGHVEVFIRMVGRNLALTIGGNTGDAVREHIRYVGDAIFCVPKALEAVPVYKTVYWWEDPAARPVVHGPWATISSREKGARAWVAKHGSPGHIRRGKLSLMVNGRLVPRYVFWTGARKRSPDFSSKAKRDANLKKVAALTGHTLRPRSSRVRVS